MVRGPPERKFVTRLPAPPCLFALATSRSFGERVAATCGVTLGAVEERGFEDGEHKTRPLPSVRGRDVYVIESLCESAEQRINDKLVRLLFNAANTMANRRTSASLTVTNTHDMWVSMTRTSRVGSG
jgi:phosphoribosylpyrophosphate synthetase